jgi:2-C-methyl-D-erythritol 4-phosphate cytidylyltransferase
VKDSIRIIDDSGHNHSIDRSKVKIIQTPQVFRADQLKLAFQQPFRDIFTDEANVWESAGHSVNLVAGELNNIKITYPSDLQLAEQILSQA